MHFSSEQASEEILNFYPKGLLDLFAESPIPSEDVFVLLVIKCTKEFHQKYKEFSTSNQMRGITVQPLDEPEIEVETFIEKTSNDVNPTVHVDEEIIENEIPEQVLPVKSSLNKPNKENNDDNYDDIISSITATEESLKFIKKAFEKLDFA